MGNKSFGSQRRSKFGRIKDILELTAGVGVAIIVCIIIILSIPIYALRQLVILWAQFFRPDLGSILNGQSSLLANELFHKRTKRCNIIACLTYKGTITLDEAEDLVLENWIRRKDCDTGKLKYPQFQQYPVRWFGFTFYKNAQESFDVKNHVHCHSNLNGKDRVTENDINAFKEMLFNDSYRIQTSPWEVHVIQNYYNSKLSQDSEMSVVVFKIHHSLTDGFGVLGALMEGFSDDPFENLKIPTPKPHKRTYLETLKASLIAPYVIMKEASHLMSYQFRNSPWKVPDERKHWHQVCATSDLISKQDIVKVKNCFGVTFSSVLTSAISAGMYRHFESRRKNALKLNSTNNNLFYYDNCSMLFSTPLPLPNHSMKLTNHTTVGVFEISTGNFSSPLERLEDCYAKLESVRTSILPYFFKFLFNAMGCHFSQVGFALAKNRSVSAGLTNFPSFPTKTGRNGKPLLSTDFLSGPLEGVCGVVVAVLSYNEHICINVSAEKAIMSREELNYFLKRISEEIDLLVNTSIEKEVKPTYKKIN